MFFHSSLVLSRESPTKSGSIFQCFKKKSVWWGEEGRSGMEGILIRNFGISWMEGLQTGLFLFGAGGVRRGSPEGGRGECWGGCRKFSQLALSLPGCWFDGWGGKGSRGSSQGFFLWAERVYCCVWLAPHGSLIHSLLLFVALDLSFLSFLD